MRERREKRTGLENFWENFLERNYWEKNFNYWEKNFLENKKKFSSSEKNYSQKSPLERTGEKLSQITSWWQKIFSRFGNYLQEEWVSGVGNDILDFGKSLANELIEWTYESWADVLDFERDLKQWRFTKYLPQKDMISQAYWWVKFAEWMTKRAIEFWWELWTWALEIWAKWLKEWLDIFGKKDWTAYKKLDELDNYLDLWQSENKKFLAREWMEKAWSFVSDLWFAWWITNKISWRLNLGKWLKEDALNFANELKAWAIEWSISWTAWAMSDNISDPWEFVKRIALEAGIWVVADVSFKWVWELYSSGKPYVEEVIKTLKKTWVWEKEIIKFLGELDRNRKLFLEWYNKKNGSVILWSWPAEFFDRSSEWFKNILENNKNKNDWERNTNQSNETYWRVEQWWLSNSDWIHSNKLTWFDSEKSNQISWELNGWWWVASSPKSWGWSVENNLENFSEQNKNFSWTGKKTRQEINNSAKKILEEKNFSSDKKNYSEVEIETLRNYTWSWGKESSWASGRWLLDEYYTPKEVVNKMWELVKTHSPNLNWNWTKKVFEPTSWIGRFFELAPEWVSLSWMELDKTSWTIAKVLHPNADIKIWDFQDIFVDKFWRKKDIWESFWTWWWKFDVVIGNPPYWLRATRQKWLWEKKDFGRQEDYFIDRWLDLLEDNWTLVYIVPSSFLKNINANAKESIASKWKLVDAYRLPEWVFEDTTIWTDILVFKKTKWEVLDLMKDNFFQKNPGKILWEICLLR